MTFFFNSGILFSWHLGSLGFLRIYTYFFTLTIFQHLEVAVRERFVPSDTN